MLGVARRMRIPEEMVQFILRWQGKVRRYDYDQLEHCFDGFFTAFVLYNILYDIICEHNQNQYPQTRDRWRAIEVVPDFLGADSIATDPDIRTNASAIKDLIELTFYIRRDVRWDREKINALGSNNSEIWAKGLLEILYQIRCNTFHGHKSYREEQKQILVPCIR